MKSEFKTKLIQHLLDKKGSEKGFTLVELLVVIIIIGILAAIALPSFLNQANKGKQAEAKTYVGTLNKGQQAYYTEKNRFGNNIEVLGVGIKDQTENYTYTVTASFDAATASNNAAVAFGIQRAVALRGYAGRVQLYKLTNTSDVTSLAVLCENNNAGGASIFPTTGTETSGPACGANAVAVGQ